MPVGDDRVADTIATDNRVRLVHALRRTPGLSQSALTRELGLGSATVSGLIAELVTTGLVTSRGFAASTGGRPAERLALDADGGPLMLGVDLGETDARFGVLDLQGRLVREDRTPLHRAHGRVELEPLLDRIRSIARSVDRVAGIGMAVPGRIAHDTHQVIRASNLGWKALPLRETVEQATGLPTVVERNTTAALLGEEWWGSAPGGEPFVFVTVGSGIGAAIKLHGRILRGASDAAGEFGHIPAVDGGLPCRCGGRGCLETVASVPALLAAYQQARRAAGAPTRGRRPSVASLADAAASDPLAAAVLRHTAERLGNGLSALISLVNPTVIVLGGELMDAEAVVLPHILATLAARGPDAPGADVELLRSTFRDRASLIGAATAGFDALLPTLARSGAAAPSPVRPTGSSRRSTRQAVRARK